jgi:ADP-ribosylglycohydrolase
MLGAIAGDVIGSVHEAAATKTKKFPLFTPDSTFTDDTVLTVAVADSLLHNRDYVDALHDYFHVAPMAHPGPGPQARRAAHPAPAPPACNLAYRACSIRYSLERVRTSKVP